MRFYIYIIPISDAVVSDNFVDSDAIYATNKYG